MLPLLTVNMTKKVFSFFQGADQTLEGSFLGEK